MMESQALQFPLCGGGSIWYVYIFHVDMVIEY